jgi:glycosyltransferase involved in cell wall biosynthesis
MDTNSKIVMQSESPLVTILMLTYNRARFLPEAIDSVLQQTYQNWELIVIDDGSTDNTAQMLAQYTDARLRVITHSTNQGLLASRQESLAGATGAYIAILDSDDAWTQSDKLATQVAFLEAHQDHVLVGTDTVLINEAGETLGTKRRFYTDKAIRARALLQNHFTHSSIVFRRSALATLPGYRTRVGEDFDLCLQLGTVGKMANLPQLATSYRVHGTGEGADRIRMTQHALDIMSKHRGHYPYYWLGVLKYRLYLLSLKLTTKK